MFGIGFEGLILNEVRYVDIICFSCCSFLLLLLFMSLCVRFCESFGSVFIESLFVIFFIVLFVMR